MCLSFINRFWATCGFTEYRKDIISKLTSESIGTSIVNSGGDDRGELWDTASSSYEKDGMGDGPVE
jgi:hypothetical protein